MKQIILVIKRSSEGGIWGRINYENNLIVESASDTTKLKRKMKKLLYDFHALGTDGVYFEIRCDV